MIMETKKWNGLKIDELPDRIRLHIGTRFVDYTVNSAITVAGMIKNAAIRLKERQEKGGKK